MENRTPTWSRTRIMSMVLVVVVTIALVMPITSYAMIRVVGGGGGLQPQAVVTTYSNGVVTQSTPGGTVGHGGYHAPTTSTTPTTSGQSTGTQVITITKTYTQTVYYTTVINNVITKYMMPVIQWEYTLVNIGQYQAQGFHSLNHEELFLPGYGGGGIFVPVFAQEAVYNFNYALTVKPTISGWYVGSQSQSTSTSTSRSATPPQLTGIQQAVDNAQQAINNIKQLATTNSNGLGSTTYVYYSSTLFNTSVFNNKTTVFILPTPYYYNNPNQNFALAWQSLTQGNIAGAAYYTGKGIYENLWNAGAWAVQQAFYFVSQASNAFNTATLAKAVAASIYGGVEGVGNALGQLFTKSWWSWP